MWRSFYHAFQRFFIFLQHFPSMIISIFFPTASAGKVMRSVVSVHLSVSILSFKPTNLWPYSCACIWVMTTDRWQLKVQVINRGKKSMQNAVCYSNIYCGILWVLIDGRSSRFPLWCHQLRGSAVTHAAWRAEASGSGGVQRVLAWQRHRSDLDPKLSPVL